MRPKCFLADFTDAVLVKISKHIGHERRRLATLLGLEKPKIEQIEQDHINDSHQMNMCILQVSFSQIFSLSLRPTHCCVCDQLGPGSLLMYPYDI